RLIAGGLGAAAATVAAVAATGQPAAAADGDPMIAGQSVTSSTNTRITASTTPLNTGAFEVVNQTSNRDAIFAVATGTGTGVHGRSTTGAGLRGESTGAGVGVEGTSQGLIGVRGTTTVGYGVRGLATSPGGIGGWFTADRAQLTLTTTGFRQPPTGDATAHVSNEVVADSQGQLWFCVADGTPGTWRKLAGPATAGSFHILPAPVRVYDSRPQNAPAVGPKTKLANNTSRLLSLRANSSGVPQGATAVAVTLLLVDAAAIDGNFIIWAQGQPRPQANTMVWGGSAGRFTSPAVTAVNPQGEVYVAASAPTNLVVDVVGYYL
ncbi:MAG: hypothetical protein JWO77_3455, partial [Ilumatobacteraceae bacterium]|nr:hypothetical protein [Ilumatobacteraceae bacterium]